VKITIEVNPFEIWGSGMKVNAGNTGGSGGLPVATGGPQQKRLRSAGNTEAFELPDDVIAAELGALEEVEDVDESDEDDSDADEDG
jgi:hypothetical protein